MRAVITAVPERVECGSGWVNLGTILARGSSGSLAPRAVERPPVFSGGGAGAPLLRRGSAASQLDPYWPGVLPAPRVRGSSATYSSVLPGVDLTVAATEAAFTGLLVVKDRAAGARLPAARPRMRIASPGLVRPNAHGGLVAVETAGGTLFAAPSARMWDARGCRPGPRGQDGTGRPVAEARDAAAAAGPPDADGHRDSVSGLAV